MKILDEQITREELRIIDSRYFEDMIKGVVDVAKNLLAIDAELHADLEKMLLQEGSLQTDLWGINLYPEYEEEDFIEYDSLINIRAYQGNPSRDVLDPEIREGIRQIVDRLIV